MNNYNCIGGEDQIIDRLTGFKEVGIYIDVGAHSPNDHVVLPNIFTTRVGVV
jgi:hypothetical protein